MILKLAWRGARAQWRRSVLVAAAVTLGVAFVCGSVLVAVSVHRTYHASLQATASTVDIYIRGPETDLGRGIGDFAPLPAALVDHVASQPGVAVAEGRISRLASLVSPGGRFLGPVGANRQTYVYSWPSSGRFLPFVLRAGRAPAGPGEVVVDSATGLSLGSTVRVGIDVASPLPARVVGVVASRAGGDLAGAISVFVDASWARSVLGIGDRWDLIDVDVTPGTAPEPVRDRLDAVVPTDGTSVITGKQYAAALVSTLAGRAAPVTDLLVALSVLALAVGFGVVVATSRIVLAQRSRELSLLRAAGMSRAQVYVMLLAEATVVGVAASTLGALAGIPAAFALRALGHRAAPLPPLTIVWWIPAILAVAGVAVTALAFAMTAARVTTLGAARSARTSRLRLPYVLSTAPALVASTQAAARRLRVPAAVVAAGVGLVCSVAVLSSSSNKSTTALVRRADRADLVVVSDAAPGVDPEAIQGIRGAPAVAAVTEVGADTFTVNGHADAFTALDTDTAAQTLDLGVVQGTLAGFADGDIAITRHAQGSLRVGDYVETQFGLPQHRYLKVTAVLADNGVTRDWVVPFETYRRGDFSTPVRTLFVKGTPGVDPARLVRQVDVGVSGFPGVSVYGAGAYTAVLARQAEGPVELVNVLVGLAIAIALLGVADVLALGVVERAPELGMLVALGMTPRQLAASVRWEAALALTLGSATGVVGGLAVGVVLGVRAHHATAVSIPILRLLAVIGLTAVAALAASAWPARRAARADCLALVTSP